MQPTKFVLGAVDSDRLAKLCGRFGSDHAGERANAAGMADRFLRERGLRWPDVLGLAPPADPWRDVLTDWPDQWREAVRLCQRADAVLSSKNRAFLATITAYQNRPSVPQLFWLHDVVDYVRAERAP